MIQKRSNSDNNIAPSENCGAGHWLGQRISAIFLTFLGLWFVWGLMNGVGQDYDQTVQWLKEPKNYVLSLLFFLSLIYHMFLGLEVIIDDYIHISFWHTFSQFLLKLFTGILLIITVWNLYLIVF